MELPSIFIRIKRFIRFLIWINEQGIREESRIAFPFTYDDVNIITPNDFIGSHNHLILDTRDFESYEISHYPGAVCIPLDTLLDEAKICFPATSRTICIYGDTSHHSHVACHLLKALGYTHVIDMGAYK